MNEIKVLDPDGDEYTDADLAMMHPDVVAQLRWEQMDNATFNRLRRRRDRRRKKVKTRASKGVRTWYVYLVEQEDQQAYALGCSSAVGLLDQLQRGNPMECQLVSRTQGMTYLEASTLVEGIGERYGVRHLRGEWYRFNRFDLEGIHAQLQEFKEGTE